MIAKIHNLIIERKSPPFIIAEMSGNHNQSLDRTLSIVEAAAKAGVHAVKLQTYTADTMTIDHDEREFYISDDKSLWQGKSLYKLYQQAYTPWEWHRPIFERCRELGIIPFSTPFDATAVDFLETLDVPCYKIASFENIDLPLIRKVASTGKPIIMSTGMATLAELDEAVRTARESGCKELILLKCTSTYPASPEESNLLTIPHMQELFGCEVGLSDHTMGIGVAVAAVALGATVIEKHFTLSRADGGVDAAFSLEPNEMRQLVEETKRAWQALGKINYGPSESEKKSLQFRRSLYVVKDMAAGEEFTPENLRSIRPGLGLSPKYYDILIGKKVKKAVKRGTPVSWDLFE
ncbi:MAG: pseudaminic acid synthase [Firmicutes bacterium]|nr:pseudaminic acid synthase [Bacillota bacterium]